LYLSKRKHFKITAFLFRSQNNPW